MKLKPKITIICPENFAVMRRRRLVVNLLGREKSNKRGVKNKQFQSSDG